MATQDMRYEDSRRRGETVDDSKRSVWSWLIPLAILLLAAIALASYFSNNNNGANGTTNGASGANSGYSQTTDSTGVTPSQ
jgi:flagellar basal body-associated protein FliL